MLALRRRAFIPLLGGVALILATGANAAEPFPTRPIRLIVPYPAGGGTDIVGRVLGQKLHQSLGQPIVIDNRGGAGGTIGTAAAAKSAPDGYSLLLVPTSHLINPSIYAKLNYNTENDFAPITMVASTAILMAVHPNVPADTVRGLIEAAKALRLCGYWNRIPPDRRAIQAACWVAAAACALSRGRTDSNRVACGRDTTRIRDHAGAAASCTCRHCTRPRGYQPAAQRYQARHSNHCGGRLPGIGCRQFVRPVCTRRHAPADHNAVARHHGRGARAA